MSLNKAFREVGRVNTERSAFNHSHTHLTTMDMGLLYPVLVKTCIPGDKWSIDVSAVLRAIPLAYPAYVDIDLNFHTYFVPMRLLWDDFEEFITGGEDGTSSLTMPKIDINSGFPAPFTFFDSIFTRLGLLPPLFSDVIPTTIFNNIPVELRPSALPLRAYYFIWNEYYRDQNLQDKIDFKNLVNVPSITTGYQGIMSVAWLKDYFTSALPFQQRGTSPSIPFEAVLSGIPNDNIISDLKFTSGESVNFTAYERLSGFSNTPYTINGDNTARFNLVNANNPSGVTRGYYVSGLDSSNDSVQAESNQTINDYLSDVKVNITDSFTISELRTAFQLQKFLERNARAGVRYTEFLQAHFNVSPSDARLDRPEFIGGVKYPVIVSDVFQTSQSTNTEPLGAYAGRGLVAGSDQGTVDYFVEEFGYIIMLAFLRPKTLYYQGINRQFQYNDRFEFPFPEFMHLSEQGITNSEIYIGTASNTFNPSEIFGYQGIYDELRFSPNIISGLMPRKDYQSWHLARVFKQEPQLNGDFITCNPRTDIFNITDGSNTAQFNADIRFEIKAVRPMPIIGEPGLIDHF